MRICVIGAGVFGIAAVREIGRRIPGASVLWLNADQEAGGLWSASSRRSLVYDSLFLNTSRRRSTFSGAPVEVATGVEFMHHSLFRAHLEDVARQCTGAERRWGCLVTSVSRSPAGGWAVRWRDPAGAQGAAAIDVVVDATGHHGAPVEPVVPPAAERDYEYLHSSAFRNAEAFRHRSVLVIGSGASGVDIACDLVSAASWVGLSIRTPPWVLPKTLFGRPVDQSSGGGLGAVPVVRGVIDRLSEAAVRRLLGPYGSYGLGEPSTPLAASQPVLSDYLLAHLRHGRLTVLPEVTELDGKGAKVADGRSVQVDVVIAATGYRDRSPHLPAEIQTSVRDGSLGLAFDVPGQPGLFLMNRFRCGDAAVRCAEVQATAIARCLRTPLGDGGVLGSRSIKVIRPAGRITARTLQKAYGGRT